MTLSVIAVAATTQTTTAAVLPAWAQVCIAFLGVLSTLGLAWIGYLQHQTRKETTEARDAAQSTERKVTSNHGNDSIGDKVDVLVDQMDEMLKLMPRVVDATHVLAKKVKGLEAAQAEMANQVADQSISNTVSFEELNHTLDDIVQEPAQPPTSVRKCRRKGCTGIKGDGEPCGYRH